MYIVIIVYFNMWFIFSDLNDTVVRHVYLRVLIICDQLNISWFIMLIYMQPLQGRLQIITGACGSWPLPLFDARLRVS